MERFRGERNQLSDFLIREFQALATTSISDAMGRTGCMRGITPLYRAAKVVGPALTVRCAPNDNLMCHYAVKVARPADVLVIDTGGHPWTSPWGELLSLSAMQRGIAGVIIDGHSRDRIQIEALGFPVFSRGVNPQGTFKQSPGRINCTISCGGIAVEPGDLVVGDDDGVVVVPRQSIEEVFRGARQVLEKEQEVRRRIAGGEVMYDFLNLAQALPAGAPSTLSEREDDVTN